MTAVYDFAGSMIIAGAVWYCFVFPLDALAVASSAFGVVRCTPVPRTLRSLALDPPPPTRDAESARPPISTTAPMMAKSL